MPEPAAAGGLGAASGPAHSWQGPEGRGQPQSAAPRRHPSRGARGCARARGAARAVRDPLLLAVDDVKLAGGVLHCSAAQRGNVAAGVRLADAEADDGSPLQAGRRHARPERLAAKVQDRRQADLQALNQAPHHAAAAAAADLVDEDELVERVKVLASAHAGRGCALRSAWQRVPLPGVAAGRTFGPGPAYFAGHGGPTTPGSSPACRRCAAGNRRLWSRRRATGQCSPGAAEGDERALKAFAKSSRGIFFSSSHWEQYGVISASTKSRTRFLNSMWVSL